MTESHAVRMVYEFPVAGHLCSDGSVRFIRLVRRRGNQHPPQGLCTRCHQLFEYRKPQRSRVRHYTSDGASHF